jgi:hypothetical protein
MAPGLVGQTVERAGDIQRDAITSAAASQAHSRVTCGQPASSVVTAHANVGERLFEFGDAMAARCSFCGSTTGPFSEVEGLFAVLMCADCQAARGHGAGPYPTVTRAELRAGLDLLPTWTLEQKASANRRVIAVMRQRLAAGEEVARMYQEPGLAWLERQAEVAEELVTERQAAAGRTTADLGSPALQG